MASTTGEVLPIAAAGLSLGLALAGAPGPVQAVLLAEAVRGGVARGFRALAGANLTFGLMLAALALGLSIATPGGVLLRALQGVGGAFLVWLAVDGFRSATQTDVPPNPRRTLSPVARGSLAVVLNPGAWLFLGAVASPLLASASRAGGTAAALLVTAAFVVGLGIGDAAVVVLGGIGLRRAERRVGTWVRRGLAVLLAGLGLWLLAVALIP